MVSPDVLSQFKGSEVLYEHRLLDGSKLLLTEGCEFVRTTFGAYWLFDLIASYQPQLVKEPFQVWKLTKYKHEALIVCEDGNHNRLLSQDIPFTDFPFDIELWQIEGTCLLPGEY